MEEQLELYFNLGNALFKLYDGQILTSEELTLIAASSNDDKIIALDLNTTKRLGTKTDKGLENFIRNSNSLKLMKLTRKKR